MKKFLPLLLVVAMIICIVPALTFGVSADAVNTAGKKAHGGDWTVTDTTLTSTANNSIYVFDDTFVAGTFEATLTKSQTGDDGIIFGLEGESYDFWEGGDRYYFLFAASGGDLILAKTGKDIGWCWMKSCAIDGWDKVSAVKIKVEYNGNGHIKIYANDKLAYDYCDGTPLTGTRYGVRAQKSGVVYSDIKVTKTEPTNEGIEGGIVFDTALTTKGEVATGYKSGGPWRGDGTAIAMNEDKTALVAGSWATAFIVDNDTLPLYDGCISARVKAANATDVNLIGIVFGFEADRNITVWKRSLYTDPYYILYVNQTGKVIIAQGGMIPNKDDGLQELAAGSVIEGYSVPDTVVDLKVEFKKTDGKLNIKGYVGNTLMVEYTDETPLTGVRYGVMGRCAGSTYYNLVAVNNVVDPLELDKTSAKFGSKDVSFTIKSGAVTSVEYQGSDDIGFGENSYTITDTKVTFKKAFLASLAAGTYTFVINGEADEIEVTITVPAPQPAQTGDAAVIAIAVLAVISLAGVAVVASKRRIAE